MTWSKLIPPPQNLQAHLKIFLKRRFPRAPILVQKFAPLNAPLKAPLNILVIVLLMKFSKELSKEHSKEHSKEQNVCTRIGTLGFGTEVRYCMTVQT